MKKIFLIFIFFIFHLEAHQLRENYLSLQYNDSTKVLEINLEVETRLLEDEELFDDSRNGIISFKELYKHQITITNYVNQHFKLYSNGKLLSLHNASIIFHRYQDQTYMQVSKTFQKINLDTLELQYDMFFKLENTHKLLIHLDEQRGDYILNTDERNYSFSNYKMSQWQRFYIFTKTGVSHILDGIDHLLFILMILIATMTKMIQSSLINILKIITIFSIAHSITLFVSGFGFYHPNTVFIESTIALSIFVVALMNFLGKYEHVNKKIVFIFGLLHGFGFANVLEIAQVNNTIEFLVALFGFNFGVELGQIFVIILLFPFLYLLSKSIFRTLIIKFITIISMITASIWFLQRIG